MINSKKVIILIVLLLLLLSVKSFATENYEINYENEYEFNYDIYTDGTTIENDELFEFLVEQSKSHVETIDVSSYKISEENAKAVITQFFLNENVYYISSAVASSYENGYLKEITVTYIYSADEIAEYEEKLSTVSQQFISEIQSDWCEMEKAVYTDIFLCKNVSFGSENEYASHTIVGALLNESATSDGYAKAFNYLIKQIGCNSIIVTSKESSISWNMVEANGEYYHVDSCGNDISGYGKTSYGYLLMTDSEMELYEHVADTNQKSAENALSADWQVNADTYLQYKDGYWYYGYYNTSSLEIDRYSFETDFEMGPEIMALESDLTWSPGVTYDGENFYISTNSEIYKLTLLDFENSECSYETYFTLEDETKLIYSIEYRDGKMYYDTTDSDDESTKKSNVCKFGDDEELTTYTTETVDTYEIIVFDTKVTLESILTSENFPVISDSSYSIKVLDEDGNEKTDTSEYIGSKNTIAIYQNDTLKIEYTAVVPGDVTGDGILRMYDAFQILKGVIKSETMDSLDCIIRDHSSSGDRVVRMYDALQYLKDAIKG